MSAHAANPPASSVAHAGHSWRNWGMISLIVGVVFLALSLVGLFLGVSGHDARPFIGWLIGSSFWLSLLIGALILTMLSYLFDAGWMVILRRQLEHFLAAFKWVALAFLPLLLVALFASASGGQPWYWLDPDHIIGHGTRVSEDPLWLKKAAYLNATFFSIRFVLYFVIWCGLAELLRRASFRMDTTGDVRHYNAAYRYSAAGVILTALALTFASIDWFGTIEYHWFSTMYGVWFFAACIRSATALLIVMAAVLASRGWLKHIYGRSHSYLLGCLLLAFTVFWAYISFAQYFLQYNANIPEEVFWYNMREFRYEDGEVVKNSWWTVSMFLVFAHFLVPFLTLLFYKNKFGLRIVAIALWVLVFHALDLYWNILPQRVIDHETGHELVRQFSISIWDVTTLIGVGGICLWAFLGSAARQKSIPIRDPRIMESVSHHE